MFVYGLNINVPSKVLQGLRGMDVCHFDVEQAFVQSKLDEDFSLRLPRGSGRLSGKTVRLNKRLYGIKPASRSWHAHLTTCLEKLPAVFSRCVRLPFD